MSRAQCGGAIADQNKLVALSKTFVRMFNILAARPAMMNARPGIKVASLTDIGRQRENNEDSYLYWEPASDDEFERKGRLAIVADGMGGYEGGLEASRLAVETVRDVYDRAFSDIPQAALLRAFAAAHERIQNYAEQHPEFYGMGTTCTAFVLRRRQVYFAHIGDSRLYLVRGTGISQLTRDHSYVGRLVDRGFRGGRGIPGGQRRTGTQPEEGRCPGALHRRPLEPGERARTRKGDPAQRPVRVLRRVGHYGPGTGWSGQYHGAGSTAGVLTAV